MPNSNRGGSRPGAGRKPGIGSAMRRVPAPVLGVVDDLLTQYKDAQGLPVSALLPTGTPVRLTLPLFDESVRAGFPSPAQGYVAKYLDLNEFLVSNAPATFFLTAEGDSMRDAGIDDQDMLIVDRSREPKSGDIVVASVGGDFTVKTLQKRKGRMELHPANPDYPVIQFSETEDDRVIAVVTWIVKKCSR